MGIFCFCIWARWANLLDDCLISSAVLSRVAIFRQKNYSAEYGTMGTDGIFVGIPPFSRSLEENLGIPFRTISRKRKTLGIPFRTISRKRKTLGILFHIMFGWKTSEFRSKPFSEEKKPQNFVRNHFRKWKNFGIPFRIIFGREKTLKKNDFCFVKLHYFTESVQFRIVLSYGMDSSEILGMIRNEHFIPQNNKNGSESIPRNFFWTKFR